MPKFHLLHERSVTSLYAKQIKFRHTDTNAVNYFRTLGSVSFNLVPLMKFSCKILLTQESQDENVVTVAIFIAGKIPGSQRLFPVIEVKKLKTIKPEAFFIYKNQN